MSFQTNAPFNAQIRAAGNRSRTVAPPRLPDIGQGAAFPGAPQTPQQQAEQPMQLNPMPQQVQSMPARPTMQPPSPQPTAMTAPAIQPQTFTMHPPGTGADPNQYNYEPQPDGSWRVYPPGVTAPQHTYQASLPRAASTADYIRMSNAFRQTTGVPTQTQAPPTY